MAALYFDPEQATDVYTRQCSLEVTARDLAVMAATLSNGGVNPLTGVRVIGPGVCRRVLAVMAIAGLYELSGDWLYEIGMPGKSGVSGGIVTVSPGKGGLATYSPPLDAAGNSVRGQLATKYLAERLGLNLFASEPRRPEHQPRLRHQIEALSAVAKPDHTAYGFSASAAVRSCFAASRTRATLSDVERDDHAEPGRRRLPDEERPAPAGVEGQVGRGEHQHPTRPSAAAPSPAPGRCPSRSTRRAASTPAGRPCWAAARPACRASGTTRCRAWCRGSRPRRPRP